MVKPRQRWWSPAPCSQGSVRSLIGDCLQTTDRVENMMRLSLGCRIQYVCVCVLAWRLPLLNKPAAHTVFFMCPCSVADRPRGISHQLVLSALQLRHWREADLCRVWGQVLRAHAVCVVVDFAFQSNVNMSYFQTEHCVFNMNYSLSLLFFQIQATEKSWMLLLMNGTVSCMLSCNVICIYTKTQWVFALMPRLMGFFLTSVLHCEQI